MDLIRMLYEHLCHVATQLQLICLAHFQSESSTQQLSKVLATTLYSCQRYSRSKLVEELTMGKSLCAYEIRVPSAVRGYHIYKDIWNPFLS